MKSEFRDLKLDSIRYSLVWEDSETLYEALNITEDDDLLIITSAGCNALNALIKKPKSVTTVDLNPSQNKLLALKKHLITHHSFKTYFALSGFLDEKQVNKAKQELLKTLAGTEKQFWSAYFVTHRNGIAETGRLEKYVTSFTSSLPLQIQTNLKQLLTFEDIALQLKFFLEHLDKSTFKQAFINHFSDENLAQGRDPKLLKYAEEPGGEAFYNRLLKQVQTILVKDNFYFRFFFFGAQNLPEHILPPCYQQQNFNLLRQNIHKLNMVDSEAIDYLSADHDFAFSKVSLSNIFEYTSHQEFQSVIDDLAKQTKYPLKIIFWNLLNSQGLTHFIAPKSVKMKQEKPSKQACFYFKNVISLQFN